MKHFGGSKSWAQTSLFWTVYFLLSDLSIFFIESTLKLMEQLFSTSIFHGPMIEDLTLLVNHGVQVHCFEFAYKGTMTMSDIFRDQSFTCLMANLSQDMLNTNRVSSLSQCLNGKFPWMNCSKTCMGILSLKWEE